jgi:hypothetical protein
LVLKNLRVFGEVCGDEALPRVLLVTTMWDQVDEAYGEIRERELKNTFWRAMLAQTARTTRHDGDYKSAQDILGFLIPGEE